MNAIRHEWTVVFLQAEILATLAEIRLSKR